MGPGKQCIYVTLCPHMLSTQEGSSITTTKVIPLSGILPSGKLPKVRFTIGKAHELIPSPVSTCSGKIPTALP